MKAVGGSEYHVRDVQAKCKILLAVYEHFKTVFADVVLACPETMGDDLYGITVGPMRVLDAHIDSLTKELLGEDVPSEDDIAWLVRAWQRAPLIITTIQNGNETLLHKILNDVNLGYEV